MSRRPDHVATPTRQIPVKPLLAALVGVALFGGVLAYAIANAGTYKKAADFRLPSLEGGTVSLSEFQGKKNVLLYFNMGTG